MGLDIIGKKTGHHISWGYSRIHYSARWLALIACGFPIDKIEIFISEPEDNRDRYFVKVDPMSLYMYHGLSADKDTIRDYTSAVQCSGYWFPNITMHSDCEGGYTKNGKDAPKTKNWQGGNSVRLLNELNRIIEDEDIKELSSKNDRVKSALECTILFRDLVKDEIENGCGTILFR